MNPPPHSGPASARAGARPTGPGAYTIMVAGAARGKTSLLRLLLDTAEIAPRALPVHSEAVAHFVAASAARTSHVRTCAIEVLAPGPAERAGEDRQSVVLNLVDTPSLDTSDPPALDRSLVDIINFIEGKFAESIEDEHKARNGDHHVHLCLYLLDPDSIVPLSPLPVPPPSSATLSTSGSSPMSTSPSSVRGAFGQAHNVVPSPLGSGTGPIPAAAATTTASIPNANPSHPLPASAPVHHNLPPPSLATPSMPTSTAFSPSPRARDPAASAISPGAIAHVTSAIGGAPLPGAGLPGTPGPPRLPPLEVHAIKALSARTNVLPVLARADTVGAARLAALKRAVRADLALAGIGFGIFDAGSEREEILGELVAAVEGGSADQSPIDARRDEQVKEEDRELAPPLTSSSGASSTSNGTTTTTASSTSTSTAPTSSPASPKARFGAQLVPLPPLPSIPRLPHAVLSPDVYAYGEGVPSLDGETHSAELVRRYMPFSSASIDGADSTHAARERRAGRFVRRYRWGSVDAVDPTHCDFAALRQAVFHHMQPLRTYTRDYLFEKFRVDVHHQRQHLALGGPGSNGGAGRYLPPAHGYAHYPSASVSLAASTSTSPRSGPLTPLVPTLPPPPSSTSSASSHTHTAARLTPGGVRSRALPPLAHAAAAQQQQERLPPLAAVASDLDREEEYERDRRERERAREEYVLERGYEYAHAQHRGEYVDEYEYDARRRYAGSSVPRRPNAVHSLNTSATQSPYRSERELLSTRPGGDVGARGLSPPPNFPPPYPYSQSHTPLPPAPAAVGQGQGQNQSQGQHAQRMHHMQHHHHGGGHGSRGPVEPDNEYDREEGPPRVYVQGAAGVDGPANGGGSGRVSPDLLKQKNKKITVACNFCRSRKLKCDGGRPSCSQCIKRSQSCDYKAHSRRRGGAPRDPRAPAQDARSDGEGDASGELDASSGEDAANGNGTRYVYEPEESVVARRGVGGASATAPAQPGLGVGLQHRPEGATAAAGTSRGNTRRSSNVDIMIAETLQSPRSAARDERALAERERAREYGYVAAAHVGTNGTDVRGHAPYMERSQLAPLPFAGVVAGAGAGVGVGAGVGGSVSTSPGAGAGVPLSSPGAGHGMDGVGLPAPIRPGQESISAPLSVGRGKRAGTKGSRVSSNYGPKVVACNFCRARKTKCDGQHPTCQSCARRSLPCSYVSEPGVNGGGRGKRGGASAAFPSGQAATQQEKQEQQDTEGTAAARDAPSTSGQDQDQDQLQSRSQSPSSPPNAPFASRTNSDSPPGSVRSKRGFADEDAAAAMETGNKRLRVGEEARLVDIKASA